MRRAAAALLLCLAGCGGGDKPEDVIAVVRKRAGRSGLLVGRYERT